MKKVAWIVQVVVLYCFTWLVSLLPEQVACRLGERLGLVMRLVLKNRRLVAEQNIQRSFEYMRTQPGWNYMIEDAKGIAREVFRTIGRSLVETCRLYHGRGDALIDRIEVRGKEHYDKARAKGKGLIFLGGHCGNWELMALAYARLFNDSIAVVARRQNSPYLNQMVERMRMRYDNRVIYKENALKNMMSVIRQDGAVGLLVDQAVLPEEGCLISFLGRPAWASKTPVLLARKTGVPIVPAFIHYEGDHHVIELFPAIEFTGDTSERGLIEDVQCYSQTIERFIVAHPKDWYWVHRRWKRAEDR